MSMTWDAYGREIATKPRRASPEMDRQKPVVRWLRAVLPQGSIVAAYQNERKGTGKTAEARARYGAMLKASGVLSGMPDLSIYLPGPRVCLIEMKAPKTGRLSTAQTERHAELKRLGFAVGVATSIDEARELLHQWGVEINRRADQMFA